MGRSHKKFAKEKRKERNFIESFEERHKDKPAVTLRGNIPSEQKDVCNGKFKESKKKSCNDGIAAVHVPIEVSKSNNDQGKQSAKKRRFLDSSSHSERDEEVEQISNGNVFDGNTLNGNNKQKPPEFKRHKILSDDSSDVQNDNAPIGQKQSVNDNFSDEDSSDDDDGDDLDDLESDDEKMLDEEDALMDEEEEDDSFVVEDEDFTDEELTSEVEDETIWGDINSSSIDLQILGYTSIQQNANCLVLKADDGFTIGTNQFQLHKFTSGPDDHSVQVGLNALHWIISPIDSQRFFSDIFQKRVLVVKRSASTYFEGFFNIKVFTDMIQNNFLEYGKDLNVASYEQGVRYTHNPVEEGKRVYSAEIREQLAKGRSVQCVHPQVFNDNIWYMCEILQEVFCSFVGANNYLTPAGSAGFAPHWDDIDAFMLQIEGKKYWKVYAPATSEDALPLESSENFADADLVGREPVFEGFLEQGDVLYVPRGFIHQAHTSPDIHSHHITISVCRRHSYADFFEMATAEFAHMLPGMSKQFRAALPPLLLDMAGTAKINYTGDESLDKMVMPVSDKAARKFNTAFSSFIPSYIDLVAREFFKTALPPLLNAEERKMSCHGGAEFNLLGPHFEFELDTEIRLIRKHTQRLLFEDEKKAFMVHRMNNSRRFGARTESIFDFPVQFEDGYVVLADCYPEWTKLRDLGLPSKSNIALAELLFKNGILLRKCRDEDDEGKDGREEKEGKKKKRGRKEADYNTAGGERDEEEGEEKTDHKEGKKRKKKKGKGQKKNRGGGADMDEMDG